LAGELLDVVVLFAFAYMAGVTYGQLYIVVEFLLLLFKVSTKCSSLYIDLAMDDN